MTDGPIQSRTLIRRALRPRWLVVAAGIALIAARVPGAARGEEPEASPGGSPPLTKRTIEQWRSEIRAALFVPEPLPPLEPEVHGRFEPAPGVMAERVSYGTQFGLRVPAILYLPRKPQGKIPALIVVNGHGGDKFSWYAF